MKKTMVRSNRLMTLEMMMTIANGNGNHNPSMNHGNRPMTGNGNSNPSMGGGFGNSHRSGSANTPSRTFGTRPSGNVASHGNGGTSTARGTFGGRR